ncbi:MAG: hypothetical protein EWV48_12305 [Microcystis aeruginosa Ma_QC_C_20070823_S13]|nr:MAG: hypothetical protein EWV56_12870 [Microcystis aeruginosa Ma_QC_C_20070823_S13D]TRU60826.1 MAG: hypothetical protein EWV48_12305 [Microcystis aeruginosa Ma_QC_C_20070823_S13]
MSSWSKAIVTAIYLRYRQQWVLFYYSSQNRVSYQLSVISFQFTDYCLLFTVYCSLKIHPTSPSP